MNGLRVKIHQSMLLTLTYRYIIRQTYIWMQVLNDLEIFFSLDNETKIGSGDRNTGRERLSPLLLSAIPYVCVTSQFCLSKKVQFRVYWSVNSNCNVRPQQLLLIFAGSSAMYDNSKFSWFFYSYHELICLLYRQIYYNGKLLRKAIQRTAWLSGSTESYFLR